MKTRRQQRTIATNVKRLAREVGWRVVRENVARFSRSRYMTLSRGKQSLAVRISSHARHQSCKCDISIDPTNPDAFDTLLKLLGSSSPS